MNTVAHFQVPLQEPLTSIATVNLNVTRSGSFGTATITWTIAPAANSQGAEVQDIGVNAGIVVIPNGDNSAVFPFTARPDTTPEVDELFVVTLAAVTESNQMILPQQVSG